MQKRSLEKLIDRGDPGWPIVQEWIKTASNKVEVLDVDRVQAEDVLLSLQVTTRSPMGAIAFETGGLLIDQGWLRLLGSGHDRICGDLRSWNSGDTFESHNLQIGHLLVIAYDVVGGFFALNSGALAGKPGDIFYFAPDTLRWENLEISYSQFLNWILTGDLALFYRNTRWPGWEQDTLALHGNQGFSIYPFLFTERDLPVAKRSRRPVPVQELWHLHLDLAQRLGDLPPDTSFTVQFGDE